MIVLLNLKIVYVERPVINSTVERKLFAKRLDDRKRISWCSSKVVNLISCVKLKSEQSLFKKYCDKENKKNVCVHGKDVRRVSYFKN